MNIHLKKSILIYKYIYITKMENIIVNYPQIELLITAIVRFVEISGNSNIGPIYFQEIPNFNFNIELYLNTVLDSLPYKLNFTIKNARIDIYFESMCFYKGPLLKTLQ